MNLFKTRRCDFRSIFCIVHRGRFWQSFYNLEKLFTVQLIMQGSKPYKNPCNKQLRRISGGEDWEGVTVMVRIRVLSRESYLRNEYDFIWATPIKKIAVPVICFPEIPTSTRVILNGTPHPRVLARLPFHFQIPGYRVIMHSCHSHSHSWWSWG